MRKIQPPPPEVEAKNAARDMHARLMTLTFGSLARNSWMVRAGTVADVAGPLHAYLVSRGLVDAYTGQLFEKLASALVGDEGDGDETPF